MDWRFERASTGEENVHVLDAACALYGGFMQQLRSEFAADNDAEHPACHHGCLCVLIIIDACVSDHENYMLIWPGP